MRRHRILQWIYVHMRYGSSLAAILSQKSSPRASKDNTDQFLNSSLNRNATLNRCNVLLQDALGWIFWPHMALYASWYCLISRLLGK